MESRRPAHQGLKGHTPDDLPDSSTGCAFGGQHLAKRRRKALQRHNRARHALIPFAPDLRIEHHEHAGATRDGQKPIDIDGDIGEVVERGARGGPFGYVRSLVEAMHARPSHIAPSKHDASAYDLVVIGSPVWAGTVSSPVRAYLYANVEGLRRVAFFCCFARRGGESAPTEMNALCGAVPLAECCVTAREARHGDANRVLYDFVERIERKLGEIQQLGAKQRELT